MDEQTIQDGKTIAIISYFTIIGSIIALLLNNEKKNQFAAFHTRQGLGLCLTYMVLGYFVSQFDNWLISSAFWIGLGVLFIFGIAAAITGKLQEVPLLGALFQKLFASIGK